jgi:precorrin-6x reductase
MVFENLSKNTPIRIVEEAGEMQRSFNNDFQVAQYAYKEQTFSQALNTQEQKEIACLITKN